MDLNTYSNLAVLTTNKALTDTELLANMAMGVGGEGGEIVDHVKKVLFHGKPLDKQHLLAEIGDCMWYLNGLVKVLDADWGEILDMNIAKLEARYPGLRFDTERANNRDLTAEAAAMEAACATAAK